MARQNKIIPSTKAIGQVEPFPLKRFRQFLKELRVQTKDFGLQRFALLGTQEYMLQEIVDGLAEGITTFVIVKARQLGSSTFFLALDIFWAFEYAGISGAFATHDDASRDYFRQMVETYLVHLPKTHKLKVRKHNRLMLVFENGSQLSYLVAGTKNKTTAGLGRGGAINFLHATEVAYWGNEDDLKELRATMSTHYPHRLQIYESTANGFNHFQEMAESADKSPTQKLIFVGWWRNELYRFAPTHPYYQAYMPEGERTPLTVLERKRRRIVKEQYDIDITSEQIAWYRWKLEAEVDSDQAKMDEMFPWSLEDAFVATGAKFFTNESLTDAMRFARTQPFAPFKYNLGMQWSDTQVIATKNPKFGELRIWEEPDQRGLYAIGVDPAYGSSDTADRTAIEVFRCYADKVIQVAEFVSPSVSTYQCAWVMAHLAGWYKNSTVILEITGPGQAVHEQVQSLRFATQTMKLPQDDEDARSIRNCLSGMRYYLHQRVDALRGDLNLHWKTTAENKLAAMNSFKDSFELQRCIIKSLPLLDEMKGMVYDEGHIEASGKAKDDRVMAAALAHHAWNARVKPMAIANSMTYLSQQGEQPTGAAAKMQSMVMNYLQKSKIKVG